MSIHPLKFRPMGDGEILFADDAGGFFKTNEAFLERYALGLLSADDQRFLDQNGHSFETQGDLDYVGFAFRWATRLYTPGEMDYVILVPTLRCNLACGYCQVSRVNEGTPGFDWNDETLDAALRFLGTLTTDHIKIEFQGGEPLLALDKLIAVRDFCRTRFEHSEFVVCTNLQAVDKDAWEFLSAPDVFISTSLDGDHSTHERQRTFRPGLTADFFRNLRYAIDTFGPGKVSALPTLDIRNLPDPTSVIQSFVSFGLHSIFLRPVNFQGFARKKFGAQNSANKWNEYHSEFLNAAIEHNWTADEPIEEFYFAHCLRRIFKPGSDGHADLRNPNILGRGYVVIDYDGGFYPTDEARMLTRVGQINLSMGNVRNRMDTTVIDRLNAEAFNNFHPDCIHCPYQAFCGVDLVDDLSRYGRIDLPKHLTDFCQRHMYLFDKAFELIYSADPKVQKSLALWLGIPEFDQELVGRHI